MFKCYTLYNCSLHIPRTTSVFFRETKIPDALVHEWHAGTYREAINLSEFPWTSVSKDSFGPRCMSYDLPCQNISFTKEMNVCPVCRNKIFWSSNWLWAIFFLTFEDINLSNIETIEQLLTSMLKFYNLLIMCQLSRRIPLFLLTAALYLLRTLNYHIENNLIFYERIIKCL